MHHPLFYEDGSDKKRKTYTKKGIDLYNDLFRLVILDRELHNKVDEHFSEDIMQEIEQGKMNQKQKRKQKDRDNRKTEIPDALNTWELTRPKGKTNEESITNDREAMKQTNDGEAMKQTIAEDRIREETEQQEEV